MTTSKLSLKSGRGGARVGAGRKAGGGNRDQKDRVLITQWLCSWFSIKAGSGGVPATDAQCEELVNGKVHRNDPVFPTERLMSGGMWGKARRGERPFSQDRIQRVCDAAQKLGYWKVTWKKNPSGQRDDPYTLTLLYLSACCIHGFSELREETRIFNACKESLIKNLQSLRAAPNSSSAKLKVKKAISHYDAATRDFNHGHPVTRADDELHDSLWDMPARRYSQELQRYIFNIERAQCALESLKPENASAWVNEQLWKLNYTVYREFKVLGGGHGLKQAALHQIKNGKPLFERAADGAWTVRAKATSKEALTIEDTEGMDPLNSLFAQI